MDSERIREIQQKTYYSDSLLTVVVPNWLKDCPLVYDWCNYNGKIYFASLNYEESEIANKPIFDLAYCATKAMNGIYIMRRQWNPKKFKKI